MSSRLDALVAPFQRWLHLPDPGPLYVTLGTVQANRISGDPVWMLLVGPAGSGKTEILQSTAELSDVHLASTITESGLLSGSPKKERASDSKGGLLPAIGEYGIILCKDFGSVLNMHREARQAVLAALREVYDGQFVRHLGTDGGRSFAWRGKIGFIGGCTPSIDRHHAVMSAMGERFLLYRMPRFNEFAQAEKALDHAGCGKEMREELTRSVSQFFEGLPCHTDQGLPTKAEREHAITLATFVARCRSGVERDPYRRDIELVPDPEAPGRIVIALDCLRGGLDAIGLPSAEAWSLVEKVAFDCMPVIRRQLIELLWADSADHTIKGLAADLGYPETTVRRHLEDLEAHRVTGHSSGRQHEYRLSDWAWEQMDTVRRFPDLSVHRKGGFPDSSAPASTLFTKVEEDISGKFAGWGGSGKQQ